MVHMKKSAFQGFIELFRLITATFNTILIEPRCHSLTNVDFTPKMVSSPPRDHIRLKIGLKLSSSTLKLTHQPTPPPTHIFMIKV